MKRIIIYLIIPLLLILAAACEDRLEVPGAIPEGVSTVEVEVGFKNFTPTLDSRSAGDAIKTIQTLWVVLYDKEGNFIRKEKITDFTPGKTEPVERPDGGQTSESKTGCAKFKLTLENGWYKMYAVANFDLAGYDDTDIDTEDKLASLPFVWSEPAAGEDYDTATKRNAQMFGYFTEAADKDKYSDAKESFSQENRLAPAVAVRGTGTQLHSWLRRAASKLTIAFDTRRLSDDVELYLKSVTIKDIPRYCHLGFSNAPGQDGMKAYENDGLTPEQRNELISKGEVIYFAGAKESDKGKENYGVWRRIGAGDSVWGLYSEKVGEHQKGTFKERLALEHSEAAPALYFFENRQPDGQLNTVSDKRQDVDKDGNGVNDNISFPEGTEEGNYEKGWKDGMPFGSYVEVKGYYHNIGTARPGKGEIIYRFMLGKDTRTNYDCERNHHYQLTMKFNGYANDVDFHIDYREEARPGLYVQDTTYVSYLYNQESFTTIRATPRQGYDLLTLEAYILDNEWRPHDVPAAQIDEMYNQRAWNNQLTLNPATNYKANAGSYNRGDISFTWNDGTANHKVTPANNIEFGYLSLRKNRQNIYELQGSGDKGAFVAKMRRLFFHSAHNSGETEYSKTNSKGYRNYGAIPANDGEFPGGDAQDGTFKITRKTHPINKSVDYIMQVPLYTRARSIDSWAVYSGANPFYRHHRYARVGFVATYKKIPGSGVAGPEQYQEFGQTHVLQAWRIDNPRGIYRRRANLTPFKVTLLYNMKTATEQQDTYISDDEIIYDEIISRGGWTVSIENDPHNFIQIQANGKTIRGSGSITGRNNTPISFVYTPMLTEAETKDEKSYGGTIFITYHNNSCSHRIVVRQGYYATTIGTGSDKVKWSAFNMYDGSTLTKSPLSIGSTFRDINNLDYPIAESNNYRDGYGVNKEPPGALYIHGKADTKWADIPSMTAVPQTSPTWKLENVHGKTYNYRLPNYKELPQIGTYTDKEHPEYDEETVKSIGQAFGICYADGSKGVLYTKGAYSYYDPENEGKDVPEGVRGVVVYSQETGDNVFFPFGSLGHPRRRGNGRLQYGSVNIKLEGLTANDFRPMAYDLLHQVGGAYWITGSSATNHAALDFNGGSYMGSFLNKGDVFQTGDKSDALPIKPIRTN